MAVPAPPSIKTNQEQRGKVLREGISSIDGPWDSYLLHGGPPSLPGSRAPPLEFGKDLKSPPLVGAEAEQ